MKKALSLLVSLLFLGYIKAYADYMTPVHPYNAKYSRGVTNTCYWIDSTASSYTTWIANAASLWNYNGYNNPIHMTAVASNYGTHMDFYGRYTYQDPSLLDNINAYTTYFNSYGVQYSAFTEDYFFTRVIINKSSSPTQATMCHEMGHSFGLEHSDDVYSIMYGDPYYRLVTSPQYCDVLAINYLYNYGE